MVETVAYLGPKGTFTHEATQSLFSDTLLELEAFPSIPDVLTAVDRGIADIGVVPVENAIEGSVNTTLDWLVHQVDIPIVGEFIMPIKQCLLVHPKQAQQPKSAFVQILSHPQAIAQCQATLKREYPLASWVFTDSTSQAAEKIRRHADQPWLAIGTSKAAKANGLHILVEDLQDYPNNVTRFIVVSRGSQNWTWEPSYQKTMMQVTLPSDYPGALYQVLTAFAWRKINLNHLESRPTKTGLGNYYFLIDAELPSDHVLMLGAIEEIQALGCSVRVLGSYPCFDIHQALQQNMIEEK